MFVFTALDPAQFSKGDQGATNQDVNKVLSNEAEAVQKLLERLGSENQKLAKSLSKIAIASPSTRKSNKGDARVEAELHATKETLATLELELHTLRAAEAERKRKEEQLKAQHRMADVWSQQSTTVSSAASASEVMRLTMLNRQLTSQLETAGKQPKSSPTFTPSRDRVGSSPSTPRCATPSSFFQPLSISSYILPSLPGDCREFWLHCPAPPPFPCST